jgi:CBS domain-containing protein
MTVKAILAAKGGDVIAIEPTALIDAAAKLMAERRIGAVLVLGADRRVAGILSERDIVRALATEGAGALQEPVAKFMTRKVVTCAPSEALHRVMEVMTTGKFRHVPVIEQGQMVGLISIGDVVKHRVEQMEREHEALQDYIRTA